MSVSIFFIYECFKVMIQTSSIIKMYIKMSKEVFIHEFIEMLFTKYKMCYKVFTSSIISNILIHTDNI